MGDPVASPGQTVGPFFHHALPYDRDRELVPPGSPGSIRLHGHVLDGAGVGVPDALVEIRQADGSGSVPRVAGSLRRNGTPFTGWGRSSTDRTGHWWFSTIEPGPAAPGSPPFFAVAVFARGLLDCLFTRIYLPDATPATDSLLRGLDGPERARLTATREPEHSLRFDIHLQGDRESIFLAFPGRRG